MPGDEEIAASLRAVNVPVIVAVNKTDDRQGPRPRGRVLHAGLRAGGRDCRRARRGDRRSAGRDHRPAADPPRIAAKVADPPATSVAIVGRPNVGKSSLLNRILREERSIVSEMPGTTRDTVDALLTWHKRDVPHRRHRRHPAARAGGAVGAARGGQRAGRAARDREGRRGGASSSTRPRARPIRTRRLPARRRRPAAA